MKYSIIIPHFNIPTLLERAVNSIPRRLDTEIIIVDDASSNECLQKVRNICNEYGTHAKLIELSKNSGGGVARNVGVENASGEFIIFLDSDDFFNDCISQILDDYASNEIYDVIFFKANSVDSETLCPSYRMDYLNQEIDKWFTNRIKFEERLRYFFGVPVCKIIRKKLIDQHGIKFDATRIHNDTTFSYMLGYHAKKIFADERAMYCATVRLNSVSKQKDSNSILTTIDILGRAVLFFRRINKRYMEDTLCHNIYILLRRKDQDSFQKAFSNLEKLGLSQSEMKNMFSYQMAKTSIKSTIWIILHSSILRVRFLSFFYGLFVAIPNNICKLLIKTI